MAYFKELIKKSLNELVEDDLKEFQWHLENDHECISKSDMENADRLKTVNKMVDRFGPEESVKIMVEILRKINQNNLAKQLENKLKQAQAEDSIEDPATVGAISKPMWVTFTNIVPRTRNDFLQYYHQFTLDPNTAYKLLRLFERNRAITKSEELQPYPDHPDRIDVCRQVLCRESVCGRCYWEIEWSGCVRISVSYKSISRKGEGNECKFGYNDQSWSLDSSPSRYSFRHNNIVNKLPVKSIIRRIGVYVDHSAGTLSFYSVSGDTMILIHTVQITFTQPLYPGFRLHVAGSFVKLC